MAKLLIKKAVTSQRIPIFVQDSSKTTGDGLAGLAWNTASLTWTYWRENEGNTGGTAVTLATMTRGTWATGGFVEKDATLMPGFYELGIPDAALATGAGWVTMVLRGATNMAPVTLEIQLVDFDPQDGTTLGIANIDAAITSRSSHTAASVITLLGTGTQVAGVSYAESLRRIGAVTSYKLSGAGGVTETVTDWADSANTIVFTVDTSGNRTAVTFN